MSMKLLGKGKHNVMAEINMIPLIDVSLVLLIIFMIMTPFLVQSQLKVQLPKATAQAPTPDQEALSLQVLQNGTYLLNNHPVRESRLEQELSLFLPRPEKQAILIQADKDVPFQYVVTALDAAKKLRVGKLGVAVLTKSEIPK